MSDIHTCCFFGHQQINETHELKEHLHNTIEKLITTHQVDTFLFGSRSRFNSLCHELVTEIKEKYPHIKRVYVRAEFPYIDDGYKAYLLEHYEHTYYPARFLRAGKAVYVERNLEMIDKSTFCVVYCVQNYAPAKRKSGTKTALMYAIKQKKEILLFPDEHFVP